MERPRVCEWSDLSQPGAVNGEALGEEVLFEIGERVIRLLDPLDTLEALRAREDLLHPHKVRKVVSLDPHLAARREHAMQGDHEIILDEAPHLVVALRPGVGERDVRGGDALFRKEARDDVLGLELHDVHILQVIARDESRDPMHPREHALGGEVIAFRVAPRHLDEERAFATAEIEIERCFATEDLRKLSAPGDVLRLPLSLLGAGEESGMIVDGYEVVRLVQAGEGA